MRRRSLTEADSRQAVAPGWDHERFLATRAWLSTVATASPLDAGKEQLHVRLHSFDFSSQGDGIAFLRSDDQSADSLVDQWDKLHSLFQSRPLIPRAVLAAVGSTSQLSAPHRPDLAHLLARAAETRCHWVAATSLDRLSADRQAELVELFGQLGVEVYIADEPLANPCRPCCERCFSPRADVWQVGQEVLCTDCREHVDTSLLLSDLAEGIGTWAEPGPAPEGAF